MKLLDGKTGIIFGVANKRSIAWAIAQSLSAAGMRLAFTYQGDRLKENVAELAGTLPKSLLYPCDVTSDTEIAGVFEALGRETGALDALVHSVAFAQREDLEGAFSKTSREGFRVAHDISAYSLVALTRAALSLLEKSGQASVRYLAADLGPKGIRVNAISAGPVNTLAARGIRGFTDILKHHADKAPLKRNVELREVGDTALFLASHLSSGITGEVIYVDCGYNIMAV